MSDVLLVEDDQDLRMALEITLSREQMSVTPVASAEAALAALERQTFRLVVSDIRMPGMDGIQLVSRICGAGTSPPVILMTAHADARIAVSALRSGARDLLLKPFTPESLVEVVRRHLPDEGAGMVPEALVARDPAMIATVARIERVARSDATILLTGESGVGKEVLARHTHAVSPRRAGPFVAINCAAIPETLLESTLFGHEKGAFSGAARQQLGKFEVAAGGTLLLDEIGELPLELQAKLLRVLQERVIERVGGTRPVAVDFRLVAATNRNLHTMVEEGRFREDLYFRLAVIPVAIPPLRDRPADVVPLARMFLARSRQALGNPNAFLTADAEEALRTHRWPGNVRELENAIQRALLLADAPDIGAAHLELSGPPGRAADRTESTPADLPPFPSASATGSPPPPEPQPALRSATTRNVRDVEREHILSVLRSLGGNRRAAIEVLGISERALRYKLKAYRDQGFDIDNYSKDPRS
jgi:two-component system response regulator FlrC